MKLVECKSSLWEFVRKLRNDPRVKKGFLNFNTISPKEQRQYMIKNADYYRVVLVDDIPAGYVGVINNDIRVGTHPDFQGKGVGKFLIESCIKIWPDTKALIKIDNKASLKLFQSCGFSKKYFILENSTKK